MKMKKIIPALLMAFALSATLGFAGCLESTEESSSPTNSSVTAPEESVPEASTPEESTEPEASTPDESTEPEISTPDESTEPEDSSSEEEEPPVPVVDGSVGKIYQNGTELVADADGNYKVDTTAEADASGLRWVTFDSAEEKLAEGYNYLRVSLKFNDFGSTMAGMVHSNFAGYNYSFGYKYSADPNVWTFWDNNYNGQAYCGAIDFATLAPYGYGYLKVYDTEDNLLMDYYQHKTTDNMGTHGGWSSYIPSLSADTEYVLEFGVIDCGDVTISGIDNATITKIEWAKTTSTTVMYSETEIGMETWTSQSIAANVSDSTTPSYTVDDPSVLYLEGDQAVALKAGTAVVTATAGSASATLTVRVEENADNAPVATVVGGDEISVGDTLSYSCTFMVCGVNADASKYTVAYSLAETEAATLSENVLTGVAAGEAKITVTVTYYGVEFTAEKTVAVKVPEVPVDPTVGKLYQNGVELKPDANGNYAVDTTAAADSYGLRWLTFDDTKASTYGYLRFKVNFSAFAGVNGAAVAPGIAAAGYLYDFGYSYGSVKAFWYNGYAGGGFGGACASDGSANQPHYFNIYTADGTKVLNAMNTSGWTAYYTMSLNTDYIFEFNVAAMGSGFTIAGFDNATISSITWAEAVLN